MGVLSSLRIKPYKETFFKDGYIIDFGNEVYSYEVSSGVFNSGIKPGFFAGMNEAMNAGINAGMNVVITSM